MAEQVTHFLENYVSPELVVFLISMLPVLELRGGLIAAKLLGIPWLTAAPVSIIGNVIPIPFILLFIKQILKLLGKFRPFFGLVQWLENKAYRKGAELMKQHPRRMQLGLLLFVAIPLPGTGAWTGSLIAAFLGMKIKDSAPPICLGVLGAAVIMLTVTYVIPGLFGF